jgi:tetratricopeptide (TPR) repeat protein
VILAIALQAPSLQAEAQTDAEAAERARSNQLFQHAEQALEHGSHDRALDLFEDYLDFTSTRLHRPERVFWAIDRVAYLYLGVKRDPDGAIAFFEKIRSDARLSDIDRGAIDEWTSVATEWRQERGQSGEGPRDAKVLFDRGKRYYDSGLEKGRMGVAYFAAADFAISGGYLRRFALLHDDDPRIGEVLYLLGSMRYRLREGDPHWSDNFNLKECIRRFPRSPVAVRCYELLRSEATRFYKPDEMPPELAESLEVYAELAHAPALAS